MHKLLSYLLPERYCVLNSSLVYCINDQYSNQSFCINYSLLYVSVLFGNLFFNGR